MSALFFYCEIFIEEWGSDYRYRFAIKLNCLSRMNFTPFTQLYLTIHDRLAGGDSDFGFATAPAPAENL
jgi:hypothetical protein